MAPRQVGPDRGRSLKEVVADWAVVRGGTLTLTQGLDAAAWPRRGVASGKAVSARALLYIIPGHVQHHVGALRARYGVGRTGA